MGTLQRTTATLPTSGSSRLEPYRGDFVAWQGGCVFLGQGGGGAIAPHSHYAIQLAIAGPMGLRVQFGRRAQWQPCAAALIPSRAVHTIDIADSAWSAVVFIEPETHEGRALTERLAGEPQCLDGETVAAGFTRLIGAWQEEREATAVEAVCVSLVRELANATSVQAPTDARVIAAVELIGRRLDDVPSLEEVAREVRLSPSRFRHLFVEHTGMPMRTYVLWRRLLRVWSLLVHGESLTDAAHVAGFADSAHLSRTARAMFGLPPSPMQVVGPLSERARVRPN
jgi:AraC-like DNA-binding protein